jgi:16S rRNA (guanine(966)-N(2))-methyltransferase RsmD
MRTQIRIVAGSLRGRKLTCNVAPDLRPMPDMVRQALFSILGNAVPGRAFYDLFAGTGAVGLEALSRGATAVHLVERDVRTANEIERHLREFGVADRATVHRGDVYRWAERWEAPSEPVTLFLGPPYPDYQYRLDSFVALVESLQLKVAPGTVIVLQCEKSFEFDKLPGHGTWDERRYGRNWLLFWVKEQPAGVDPSPAPAPDDGP